MWSARLIGLAILLCTATAGMSAPPPFRVNTGFTPPVSTIFKQVMQEYSAGWGNDSIFRRWLGSAP
jgi:hypothetical protein